MSAIAGSRNTLLGYGAALPNAAASNQIVIGTQAETTHIATGAGGGVVISQSALTLSGNTALTVSGNAGTAGQYMVTGGAGSAPYWGPKAPQSLTGVSWTLANPLSNLYKIQGAGSASWNLALPGPAAAAGSSIWVKNMASASGAVSPSIVNQGSTDVVSNVMMMQGDSASFLSDGASWYVVSASENLVTNPLYISSVTPATGSDAGGTVLTITGTGFTGASAVTVGGVNAPITSATATQIVATAPAGTAGSASVVVVAPLGTSLPNQLYTYLPPPTVTSITPVYGSIVGGTAVTITGTNFTGATSVTVGGAVQSFSVVNSTTITALTGAGTAGPANVSVTTPVDTGTGIGLYTYETTPTVAGISPSFGIIGGGTAVTITGTGFLGATAVSVGGAVQSYTVVNDTTITAQTGVGVVGPAAVSVTTPEGTGSAGLFTYVSAAFSYTGANQNWQVPTGVSQVSATVAGSVGENAGGLGGAGGCTITGTLAVTPGTTLTIVCGGYDGSYAGSGYWQAYGPVPGYGGGYSAVLTTNVNGAGKPTVSEDIYIMAGGGGGNGSESSPRLGGIGGYLQGGNSQPEEGAGAAYYASGGTQTQGGTGSPATYGSPGANGSQYQGGAGGYRNAYNTALGGGGGGGWYGGGGGSSAFGNAVGGGGGSSYPVANTDKVTIMSHTDGSNGGTGYVTLTWG